MIKSKKLATVAVCALGLILQDSEDLRGIGLTVVIEMEGGRDITSEAEELDDEREERIAGHFKGLKHKLKTPVGV